MAALDFPASPSSGQRYSANGSTWEWNGSAWIKLATSSGPTDQVTTANDISTAALYPLMVDGAGDNKALKVSTSKLKFDASAGGLTVTGTSGEVTAGVGNTALIVDGDARVLGILTVGSGTVKIDSAGVTATGVATFTNFKTGTTNVHNVGVEAAGINVLGADTPIGTGATVYNSGLIVSKSGGEYQGVVTASTFKGAVEGTVQTAAQPNITSLGTLGSLNVTGNATIGGVLTYEDVKNVDAIGIITARAGIRVTGGKVGIGTDDPSGSLGVWDASGSDPTMSLHHSNADVEGEIIRVARTDLNTIRYHSIKAKHGGSANANFIAFNLHNGGSGGGYTEQTDVLRIVGNGNVGINTNNPANRLTVWADVSDTDTDVFQIRGKTGAFNIRVNDADAANPEWAIRTYASEPIVFMQGTQEKARLHSDGRVGIGSAIPAARLDVVDTSGLGIISRSATTQATNTNKALKVRNNSTDNTFSVSYRGRGYLADRLGIGTESPQSALHFFSDAPIIKVEPTNWQSGLRVDVMGMGNNAGNGQLFRIQKDAATKFQINEDGDAVVYGDDNAELKLQCGTSDGNNIISFINSSGTTKGNIFYDSDHNFMVFKTNGSASANERLRITSAGEVKIVNDGFLTIVPTPASTYGVSEALRIDNGGTYGDRGLQIFEYQHGGTRSHRIQFNTNTTTNGSAYTHTQGNWGGSSSIAFDNDGDLIFYTNAQVTGGSTDSITPSERLHIHSSGNVKIGSGTPGAKFHVEESNTTAYNASATTSAATLYLVNTGTNGPLGIILQNASTDGSNTCQATIHSVAEGTTKATRLSFGTRDGNGDNKEKFQITSGGVAAASQFAAYNPIGAANIQSRDKFRVWNSSAYTIGMKSGFTFGAIGGNGGGSDGYAMTFQMNSTSTRGWWFGTNAQTDAQGAMSVNTIGELVTAKSIRAGGGTSDLLVPRKPLDIIGDGIISGKFGIGTDDPSEDLEVKGDQTATIFINAGQHDASTAQEAQLKLGFNQSHANDSIGYVKLIEGGGNAYDGDLAFGVPYNNSGTPATREVIRAKWSGRVGIGTDAPQDVLTLYDADNNVGVYFQSPNTGNSGGDGLRIGRNDTHAFIWNYENQPIAFATGGTERVTISNNNDTATLELQDNIIGGVKVSVTDETMSSDIHMPRKGCILAITSFSSYDTYPQPVCSGFVYMDMGNSRLVRVMYTQAGVDESNDSNVSQDLRAYNGALDTTVSNYTDGCTTIATGSADKTFRIVNRTGNNYVYTCTFL